MEQQNDIVFQEERLANILSLLNKSDRLVTKDLPKILHTTAVTIRKDLAILDRRGLLKRTHGGAIKVTRLFPGLSLNEKEKINLEEKLKIAKQAATFISEGDTIVLDSGSTISLLAREIRQKSRITVITNATNIADELKNSDMDVILVGGTLLKKTSTLVGPLADETLRRISADKHFMSVDGIDFETGLTTPDLQEAQTSRVMMQISAETIVLADSSKFGRRSLAVISPLKDIQRIVTTKKLTEHEMEKLRKDHIEVFQV
jgi:DeoR/GlpR family transcriptional regulator of sugar metabolism